MRERRPLPDRDALPGRFVEIGNIVCGELFWAMAAPAWLAMVIALKESIRKSKDERDAAKARASMWAAGSLEGSLWWWLIYAVLVAGDAFFGVATYSLAAA